MKPLKIDKRDRVKGLFVYCQKCQRLIDNGICGTTNKRLSTCKNTDKHKFKAVVAVPYTGGTKRKTKVFQTRNLQEAIAQKLEFVNELEKNNFQNTDVLNDEEKIVKPELLIDCMAMYIGFINNEGVAAHKVRLRSKGYTKDIERFFKYFCLSLKSNNIDHTLITIDKVSEKTVGFFHNYIIDELKYQNKTYNNLMGTMRHFIDWLIEYKEYDIQNHFKGITRRSEVIDKTIVSKIEFNKLLNVVKPERGMKEYSTGERKNLYRNWLTAAFRLAVETGLRREEFMSIKFTDIVENEVGVPTIINIENFKVNRKNDVSGTDNAAMKHVPITKSLLALLKELGYDDNKKLDKYIIATDEQTALRTRIDVVSKAFTHYWQFTELTKKAQLKHLRKTYLTALVKQFGEKASIISSHSGIKVLKDHYVNDLEVIKATQNFSVF